MHPQLEVELDVSIDELDDNDTYRSGASSCRRWKFERGKVSPCKHGGKDRDSKHSTTIHDWQMHDHVRDYCRA